MRRRLTIYRSRLHRALVDRISMRTRSRLRAAYRPVTSLFYRGNAVECPVCDRTFRAFRDKRHGSGFVRENVQCPRCGSLERHRLMWLFLRDRTDLLSARHRLLHIAPEPGFERRLRKAPGLDYLSGDLNGPPSMLAVDVTDLPFRDGWFDVVICNHVLEHVIDDETAMRELHRVLQPGGWAIITVPADLSMRATEEDPAVTDPLERQRRYHQFDHVRLYGTDFFDRLEATGFAVTRTALADELGPDARRRFSLMDGDEVAVSAKPVLARTADGVQATGLRS